MRLLSAYPVELFYVVLVIGLGLALFSPYKAFLFSVFGLSARHLAASVQTRIFLGPYFNLNDAFIIIGIAALFVRIVVQRKPLRFPLPAAILFVILIISIVNGYFAVGDFDINVVRYSKYSLIFPILFLLSANFISDSKSAKEFFFVLLAGGITASLQHILLSVQAYSVNLAVLKVRDIGFLLHPGYYFLLAALQERFDLRKERIILLLSLPLFAVSLILDQTRSVWLSMFGAALLTPLVIKIPIRRLARIAFASPFFFLAIVVLFPYIFLGESPVEIVEVRLAQMFEQYSSGTSGREIGGQLEWNAWLSGNILIGRGMGSQAAFAGGYLDDESAAFGHIGYLSYLTYTGLLGFLVYSIYIPVEVLRAGKRLYDSSQHEEYVRSLAVIGISCILMHAIVALFTSGYIGPTNAGVYYGAVLGLAYALNAKEGAVYAVNIDYTSELKARDN